MCRCKRCNYCKCEEERMSEYERDIENKAMLNPIPQEGMFYFYSIILTIVSIVFFGFMFLS